MDSVSGPMGPIAYRTQMFDAIDTVSAAAYGVGFKGAELADRVERGGRLTEAEINALVARSNRLREAVERCRVLVSATFRAQE